MKSIERQILYMWRGQAAKKEAEQTEEDSNSSGGFMLSF
jgi:hypothetical protein